MTANPSRPSREDARKATAEAAAQTGKAINQLARTASTAVQERIDGLGINSKDYVDYAGDKLEDVQQYVTGKIKEQPVKAALAALGIGVVLGFLLSR